MTARPCCRSRPRSLATPSSLSSRSLCLAYPPEPICLFVASSPARRRGASVAFGALPPRGRAACSAPSRLRSSAPSPSSRSSSSIGLAAPPERRARLDRGQVQPGRASWASRAVPLAAVAPRPRATPRRAHDDACRAELCARMRRADSRGISRAYQPDTAEVYQPDTELIRGIKGVSG